MRVVFRTDASLAIGTGHVMRCLTLAESLRSAGAAVRFFTRPMPGSLEDVIEKRGFSVTSLEPRFELPSAANDDYAAWLGVPWQDDARETVRIAGSLSEPVDWLVVDHYGLDQGWERMARSTVESICVIDDLANRPHDCDMLLDTNFSHNAESRYAGLVPEGCQLMMGPKYALLRTEFTEARKKLQRNKGRLERVLLFFGGVDRPNMTQRALDGAIAALGDDVTIDVIVGGSNPHAEQLTAACGNLGNVTIRKQVNDMARHMAQADLAIGAGGTTTWERCALGLPSLIIALAENQEPIGEEAERSGVARYLGHEREVTAETIAREVHKLADSPQDLAVMSVIALELVDGNGAKRVADQMLAGVAEGAHA